MVEPLARDAFGERIADLRHDVFGEHAPLGADTVREADGVIALPRADIGDGHPRRDPGLVHHIGRLVERSEEHTSELQSLMRISYAVFCLKKKKKTETIIEYMY